MSATFHGLEVAKSGLVASQIALDVTSQNIANAKTEGYTRQSVVQNSVSAGLGPFQYAPAGTAVGQGANITSIMQNRDGYLDTRYRNANATYNTFSSSLSALKSISGVLDEADTDGLNAVLADFYSSLQDLSNNKGGVEYASLVRSAAEKVTNTLNEYASQFAQIKDELNYDLSLSVEDVNSLVGKISELNSTIEIATIDGTDCNELKDSRNVYLDKLSGYMNISVINNTNGTVSIKSGTGTLLDASTGTVTTLSVGNASGDVAVVDGSGNNFEITDGSIKGMLQSLNGAGVYAGAGADSFPGIIYYQKAADDLAASFASTYNSLNSAKGNLFAASGGGTITASNICVSDDWTNSTGFIDTSGSCPSDMLAAMNKKIAISGNFTGTFEEYSALMMNNIATDTSYYSDMTSSKSAIVESIEDDRQAISGVSIDEETINTIKYQKAYQAAARVMTVLDEMLDTLINRMAV